MTPETLAQVVREELSVLAPEADLSSLSPSADLREALDLDSFDFMRLLTALDQRLGVPVPEVDYGQLQTLEGCLRYLSEQLSRRRSS